MKLILTTIKDTFQAKRIRRGLVESMAISCVILITSTACFSPVKLNVQMRNKLETRAKFDLNCDQLELAPLESLSNGITTSYGVTGCGRRSTYVLNIYSDTWMMNVSDGNAASSKETAPPPQVPSK